MYLSKALHKRQHQKIKNNKKLKIKEERKS